MTRHWSRIDGRPRPATPPELFADNPPADAVAAHALECARVAALNELDDLVSSLQATKRALESKRGDAVVSSFIDHESLATALARFNALQRQRRAIEENKASVRSLHGDENPTAVDGADAPMPARAMAHA